MQNFHSIQQHCHFMKMMPNSTGPYWIPQHWVVETFCIQWTPNDVNLEEMPVTSEAALSMYNLAFGYHISTHTALLKVWYAFGLKFSIKTGFVQSHCVDYIYCSIALLQGKVCCWFQSITIKNFAFEYYFMLCCLFSHLRVLF